MKMSSKRKVVLVTKEKINNEEDKKALYMQEYKEACMNVRH